MLVISKYQSPVFGELEEVIFDEDQMALGFTDSEQIVILELRPYMEWFSKNYEPAKTAKDYYGQENPCRSVNLDAAIMLDVHKTETFVIDYLKDIKF